jgi:hypothetical protein
MLDARRLDRYSVEPQLSMSAELPVNAGGASVAPVSCEDSLRLGQEVVDRLHEAARLLQVRVDFSRRLVGENRLLIASLSSPCRFLGTHDDRG